MSEIDNEFATQPSHAVACAVNDIHRALADLRLIESTGFGYEIVRDELIDLEIAHDQLGRLIRSIINREDETVRAITNRKESAA